MQPTNFKIDINKIQLQCANLDKIAKTKKWILSYDEDCDCLYYSPKKISKNTQPLTFKDDFSLFIDENSNVEGFYIEYYKSNLTSHDERFKPMKNLFNNDRESQRNKIEKEHLVQIVIKDILTDIVNNKSKFQNIELQAFC